MPDRGPRPDGEIGFEIRSQVHARGRVDHDPVASMFAKRALRSATPKVLHASTNLANAVPFRVRHESHLPWDYRCILALSV
jgi:hypothetical protein